LESKGMSQGTPLLEIKNVSKTFDGVVRALDNVSLSVNERQIASVVGENGAGKTTLMKILAGVYQPDVGELYYKGVKVPFPKNPKEAVRRGISIVYQERGVIPHLKVYQFLILGCEDKFIKFFRIHTGEAKKYAMEILDELRINCDPEKYMYELPIPTQKLIEIARAILNIRIECRDYNITPIIILDEPTAPLEIEERKELFNYLLNMKKNYSFIFVSHIIPEVMEFTDVVYVLRDGKLVSRHDLRRERITEEDLFKEIVGRESSEYLLKYKPYEEKVLREDKVLSIRNLTKKGSYYDVSFDLFRGECIGFFGPAGSGKSEIAKTIYGVINFDSGDLTIKNKKAGEKEPPYARIKMGIGYFSGETGKELFLNWSVAKNLSAINLDKIIKRIGAVSVINFNAEKLLAEKIMKKLNIRAPNLNTECYFLSGGNKQKVSVGKWLEKAPDILVLEDPTIGIDVGAREEIYETLLEMKRNGIAMILVSDDPKEYAILCDKIVFLKDGKIQRVLSNEEYRKVMEL
jgi:ABC-type sugar transport system ATPase subunit